LTSGYSTTNHFTTGASFLVSGGVTKEDLQTRAPGINLYPNPANHTAVIQFNSSKVSDYKLELTEVSGKVLQTKRASYLPE